jgi:hypothetical protein
VLPAGLADVRPGARTPASGAALAGEVVVRDDADLGALVRRIASLCDDPVARAALREGRHGFRLTGTAGSSRAHAENSAAPVARIERGAVTERAVAKAAADGVRLVLGVKAVLTPLAREKARALGVEIEKEH